MDDRPGYEAALRAADKTFETPPHLPDLAPMKAWLRGLLSIQIVSVTDAGVTGARPAPGSPDAPEPGT